MDEASTQVLWASIATIVARSAISWKHASLLPVYLAAIPLVRQSSRDAL